MNANPRTSITHPLLINELECGAGRLGLTFCPGKQGDSLGNPVPWHRDLELDLEIIRCWGAVQVVTLMESHELTLLNVDALGPGVEARGMEWLHLPIVDQQAPNQRWDDDWEREFGVRLRQTLRGGGRVLLHCRGGLGRTGLVAARLLVEFGEQPEEAIKRVRRARPRAIETLVQEDYVRRCLPAG